MGRNSNIEWTDATFNPWWGCTHAGSPGCDNCYAKREVKRFGFDCFGPGKARRRFGEKYWNGPRRWNKIAMKTGKRIKVFCGSMCDVFDPDGPRADFIRLLELIKDTPSLFWLLLTKRPENIWEMIPSHGFPRNLGLGVTVETQVQEWRIEEMLTYSAALYFVSHEPALGNVWWPKSFLSLKNAWLITGGESGPEARPMHPDWVRNDRDQCQAAGIPYFFKQWGEWRVGESKDFGKFSEDTSIKQYMVRVGKRETGRSLDGREWNEFPI